jgi:hypothetical protein
VLGGAVIAASGCGGRKATPQEQRLERADLIDVSRALEGAEPSVRGEVAATKGAWPLVVDGLPADANAGARSRAAIQLASQRAAALRLPAVFEEHEAASLTGPGSGVAGTFRGFNVLSARGWRLIDAAAEQVEHGDPTAARFARENVALYIECVYDAHFGLAQIGRHMLAAYNTLGGAKAFGASLTQAEIDGLADFYSEANDRLRPRSRVRLGS